MAFYDRMKAVAENLIYKFGQNVVLERTTAQTINPVTGEVTGGGVEILNTRGILQNYDAKDIDGTLILATDKKLLIDGSVAPLITDNPKVGNKYLGAIVSIKEVAPDVETSLVFVLQVRG